MQIYWAAISNQGLFGMSPQIQFVRPPVSHKIIFSYGCDKTSEHIELETAGDKQKLCWFVQGNADSNWTCGLGRWWLEIPHFPSPSLLEFNAFIDFEEFCTILVENKSQLCEDPFPGCKGRGAEESLDHRILRAQDWRKEPLTLGQIRRVRTL